MCWLYMCCFALLRGGMVLELCWGGPRGRLDVRFYVALMMMRRVVLEGFLSGGCGGFTVSCRRGDAEACTCFRGHSFWCGDYFWQGSEDALGTV